MSRGRRAPRYDQTAIRGTREGRDGSLYLAGVAHVDRAHFHSYGRGHGLDGSELSHSGRIEGISKNSRSLHARLDLLEQFQQFGVQTVFGQHKAGDVAARLGKAIDEARADRIAADREYDRKRTRALLKDAHARRARGEYNDVPASAQFHRAIV